MEASGHQKSELYTQIEDMFLNQRMTRSAIHRALRGRASKSTVTEYCTRAIKKADRPFEARNNPVGAAALGHDVLSPTHHAIGVRLLQHRFIAEGGISPGAYAAKHGVGNQVSLTRMEHGKYDFTLSEILQISDVLGVSVRELLSKKEEG